MPVNMSTVSYLVAAVVMATLPAATSAQSASQENRLQSIVLDSGVTLADWVRITRSREPSPSLATGEQAAQYVRQHGAFRELLDIVWRAAQQRDLQRESIGPENAAQRLAAVNQARRLLGDWPTLVMASATAKAYLGDSTGANEDLRRWMAVAPASDVSRERVTEVLLSIAQKPDAAVLWLTQTGVGAIPLALRRPVDAYFDKYSKEIARARECLGPVTRYEELAVLQEGSWTHNGEPAAFRVDHRMNELGLSSFTVTWLKGFTERESTYDQNVHSPAGGTWSRKEWPGETSTAHYVASRNIKCTSSLLPVAKGKQVQVAWESETSTDTRNANGTDRSSFIFRHGLAIEFLSDEMTPDEITRLFPSIRLLLPANYLGRFFRVKWRISLEDISPAGSSFRVPPSQTEREGLFVEGPNALITLVGDSSMKPGSIWTLTRPEPS